MLCVVFVVRQTVMAKYEHSIKYIQVASGVMMISKPIVTRSNVMERLAEQRALASLHSEKHL